MPGLFLPGVVGLFGGFFFGCRRQWQSTVQSKGPSQVPTPAKGDNQPQARDSVQNIRVRLINRLEPVNSFRTTNRHRLITHLRARTWHQLNVSRLQGAGRSSSRLVRGQVPQIIPTFVRRFKTNAWSHAQTLPKVGRLAQRLSPQKSQNCHYSTSDLNHQGKFGHLLSNHYFPLLTGCFTSL